MNVTMNQVEAVMDLFQSLQDKYEYRGELENIVQQKWNMRAVMQQMPSREDMTQLVKFFMLYSDDRSFKEFFYHYNEYYDSMLRVRNDRLHRRWLQQQTLQKKDQKEEEPNVES